MKAAFIVFLFFIVTAIASPAQTLTDLVNFDFSDGAFPKLVSSIQGTDGNLYGTTSEGGASGSINGGTVFKATLAGTLTTLHNFCVQANCADGNDPSGLVQAADGNFYGTTVGGGANCQPQLGCGTVFRMTPEGKLTTLYSFCAPANCADGGGPIGVVQAADGDFYGITFGGGANCQPSGCGTVFKMTPKGKLTTLYSFCALANCADGTNPYGLLQASDGDFYGTTSGGGGANCWGGKYGCGTVFRITAASELTTLYRFCAQDYYCPDGYGPRAGLVKGMDGNFYGTAAYGGAVNCGTVFRITPTGTLTTLFSFNCLDGESPYAELVQGTDGNFYGTTSAGGGVYSGTVFKITPEGALTTLYNFYTEGDVPMAGLLQATNGDFYGTTEYGGSWGKGWCAIGCGTVFSLTTGLGPFVATNPASGSEGAKVNILGQGFTSDSVVEFGGGVQATTVTLNGSTDLIATVPAGALTGHVTVTTGGTTLTGNAPFRVTPKLLRFSPTRGPVGTVVTITGSGFTQTLRVGFGDTVPANEVRVNSDTSLTATVPTGAKTGPVGVQTKSGIGISSLTFTVTQ